MFKSRVKNCLKKRLFLKYLSYNVLKVLIYIGILLFVKVNEM